MSSALPPADDGLLVQLPCDSLVVQLPPEDSGNLVLPCDDDADLVVQLPTDSKANADSLLGSVATLPDQCCSMDCMRKLHPFIASTCYERKRQMTKLSFREASSYLLHLVSTCCIGKTKRRTWYIDPKDENTHICFRSWCSAHGVGKQRVAKMQASLMSGLPPNDLRAFNKGGSYNSDATFRRATCTCNAFFSFAHENMAGNLAETLVDENSQYIAREVLPENEDDDTVLTEASLYENIVSAMAVPLKEREREREKKWLPYQSQRDLYNSMCSWITSSIEHDAVPSYRTFCKVWCVWNNSKSLRTRQRGQHARCTLCAECSDRLSKEHDMDAKAEIIATRERHLSSIFADRDLEYRLNLKRAQS